MTSPGLIVNRLLRSTLVHNLLSMSSIQAMGYLFPLLLVPYLARALGPPAWGKLAVAQVFSMYVSTFIQYGFGFSGVRDLAGAHGDPESRSALLGAITAAKLTLVVPAALVTLGVIIALPTVRQDAGLAWAALLYGTVMGLNLNWYFQGREKMHAMAMLQFANSGAAMIGVFLFVKSSADVDLYLIVFSTTTAATLAAAIALAVRETPWKTPSLAETLNVLRLGSRAFFVTATSSLYTAGNSLLLSFFVTPEIVAFYSAAEKLIRAYKGFYGPINGALYPRLSRYVQHDRPKALALIRLSLKANIGLSVIVSAVLLLFAQPIMLVLYGQKFAPAIIDLEIMSVLPVIFAFSQVLAVQWMFALNMDGKVLLVTTLGGILSLASAVVFVPRFGDVGMSIALAVTEFAVSVVLVYLLWREGTFPYHPSASFHFGLKSEPGSAPERVQLQ